MATHPPEKTSSTAVQAPSHSLFPPGQIVPFILVTFLFFLWGVPNNLNDVLIRHFMKSFEITRFQAGLVQFAFYMGYFFLAIPAALMMKRAGYKAGFVVGLLLYAVGAFLFWPAAVQGSYLFFLFALFVIASGLSFLETASNPFIAQLGDPDSSERRLNFSQAFNPFGAITGALVGTIFIFSGVELTPAEIAARQAQHTYQAYLQSETLRVVRPYLVIGVVALIWAALILRTKFPAIASERETAADHGSFLRAAGAPAFPAGRSGAIFLCGRAGGHVELFYFVCSGIRARAGKNGGIFSHRHAGGILHWPLPCRIPNAVCFAELADGLLRNGEYRSCGPRSFPARLDWHLEPLAGQLIYVPDVPNDIRARVEGPGAEYQTWRIVSGDGDCWRRRAYTRDGLDFREFSQPGAGL